MGVCSMSVESVVGGPSRRSGGVNVGGCGAKCRSAQRREVQK